MIPTRESDSMNGFTRVKVGEFELIFMTDPPSKQSPPIYLFGDENPPFKETKP